MGVALADEAMTPVILVGGKAASAILELAQVAFGGVAVVGEVLEVLCLVGDAMSVSVTPAPRRVSLASTNPKFRPSQATIWRPVCSLCRTNLEWRNDASINLEAAIQSFSRDAGVD